MGSDYSSLCGHSGLVLLDRRMLQILHAGFRWFGLGSLFLDKPCAFAFGSFGSGAVMTILHHFKRGFGWGLGRDLARWVIRGMLGR